MLTLFYSYDIYTGDDKKTIGTIMSKNGHITHSFFKNNKK